MPIPRAPRRALETLLILDEQLDLHSTDTLPMVHCTQTWQTKNGSVGLSEGQPEWQTASNSLFSNSSNNGEYLNVYKRGGPVMNISIFVATDKPLKVASVMICDFSTCPDCSESYEPPSSVHSGPGTSRGLPLVHSNSLHIPAGQMGLCFNKDWKQPPPDPYASSMTAAEKKLVRFELPYHGGHGATVSTAVCIPAHCDTCRSGSNSPRAENSPNNEPSMPGDDEGTFDIESIVGSRWMRGRFEYLVSWEGFSPADQTWEPIYSLIVFSEHIWKYHNRWPFSARPTPAQVQEYGLVLPPRPPRKGIPPYSPWSEEGL